MNWRRLRSSMGSSQEPAVPAYSRLRMHRKRPQVLGVDLNRSESTCSLMTQGFLPRTVPNRRSQRTLRNKGFFTASVPTRTEVDERVGALEPWWRRTRDLDDPEAAR